jgi:polysaccharide export outer membrane protein
MRAVASALTALAIGQALTATAYGQQRPAPAAPAPAATPAPAAAPAVPAPLADSADYEYVIGSEDTLSIVVWKNEALSKSVPVRPDGKITLPLLNDVQASGFTAMQLKDELTKKFTEFMPAPEVSVTVTAPNSFKVSVIGQVASQGRFTLRSRLTVLDIIAQVGGFKDNASPAKVVVLRLEGKNFKRIPFNYYKVLLAGGEAENFALLPNDIVLVP